MASARQSLSIGLAASRNVLLAHADSHLPHRGAPLGAGGSCHRRNTAYRSRANAHRAAHRYAPRRCRPTAWFAVDQGFFAQNGLDVTIDVITSGSAILAGLAGGALDVGVASIGSLSTAHARGLPIVALAPGGLYNGALPTSVLAVLVNSPLRTAKDLTGKTIAIQTIGELASFAMISWIDKNGGDGKSVKFVELPTSSMADALASGHVDAAFLAERSTRRRNPPYVSSAPPTTA